MKKKKFKNFFSRMISCLTLLCFVANHTAFSAPAQPLSLEWNGPRLAATVPAPFLGIPKEIGKFDGLFTAPSGDQTVFIYHVKDAHASREAQKNIVRILDRLHDRQQADLVLLEGASGDLVPERLEMFKNPERNVLFMKGLFDADLMNGAAYFTAGHREIRSRGLEDPAMYFRHLKIFREIVASRPSAQAFFNQVEVSLLQVSKKILRADIFAFLKEWQRCYKNRSVWGSYLPFLIRNGQQFLGDDFLDYRMQTAWPQLVRFHYLDTMKDEIKFGAVQKEYRQLSGKLMSKKDRRTRQVLGFLEAVLEDPDAPVRESPHFRSYAETLMEICQKQGIFLQEYPELSRYLAFRIFRSEIDPAALWIEAQRLEDRIFDRLFSRGPLRRFFSLSRDFFLMQRAFSLQLNRSESKQFQALDVEARVREFLRGGLGKNDSGEAMIRGARWVKRFYAAAQARDRVFERQLEKNLRDAPALSGRPFYIVVITGGYHTESMEGWLQAHGISYAGIQPSFKDEPDERGYQDLLLGNYMPRDTLAPAQAGILSDANAAAMIGDEALQNFRRSEIRIKQRLETARSNVSSPVQQISVFNKQGRMTRFRKLFFHLFSWLLIIGTVFLGGCATLSHEELKGRLAQNEAYVLPESRQVQAAPVQLDEVSLFKKVLQNDPRVHQAELTVKVKETDKQRAEGGWTVSTKLGLKDGKPTFSAGIRYQLPYAGEIALTGVGLGDAMNVAFDLLASLGSYLRGEPLLARAFIGKVAEASMFHHQKVIDQRYTHYVGLAIRAKALQEEFAIAQQTLAVIEEALQISQGRGEQSAITQNKIELLKMSWQAQALQAEKELKTVQGQLLTIYAPGATGQPAFDIQIVPAVLPPEWKLTPGLERRMRDLVTQKEGVHMPKNRELAMAYKALEAAKITAELAQARNRFTLFFGGSFRSNADEAPLPEFKPDTVQVRSGKTFGGALNADEQKALLEAQISESVLREIKMKIDEEVSRLLLVISTGQTEILMLQRNIRTQEEFLRKAGQKTSSGHAVHTSDELVEARVELQKLKIGLSQATWRVTEAFLTIEVLAGKLGAFDWDQGWLINAVGRSEVRVGRAMGREGEASFWKKYGRYFLMMLIGAACLFVFSQPAAASGVPSSLPGAVTLSREAGRLAEGDAARLRDSAVSPVMAVLLSELPQKEPEGNPVKDTLRAAPGQEETKDSVAGVLGIVPRDGLASKEKVWVAAVGPEGDVPGTDRVMSDAPALPLTVKGDLKGPGGPEDLSRVPPVKAKKDDKKVFQKKGRSFQKPPGHEERKTAAQAPQVFEKTPGEQAPDVVVSQGSAEPREAVKPVGTVLFQATGLASINTLSPLSLKLPFRADEMVTRLKTGDRVTKGMLLAQGVSHERAQRIRSLQGEIAELERLLANRNLNQRMYLKYTFEKKELEFRLSGLQAEESSNKLLSPRSGVVRIIQQGAVTSNEVIMELVPDDEGVLELVMPPHYVGADDVILSVDGRPVRVISWEAGGFDLAKGPEGEVHVRLHFISSVPLSKGKSTYEVEFYKNDRVQVDGSQNIFTTMVPPPRSFPVAVPALAGVPSGMFQPLVQEGQWVHAGQSLARVLVPSAQDAVAVRKANELGGLARTMRRENQSFRVLGESDLRDYEARAETALAGVRRGEASYVPVNAPVAGYAEGVTIVAGQNMALGGSSGIRVRDSVVFLGTSIDPRSDNWQATVANDDPFLIPVKKGTVKAGDKVSIVSGRGMMTGVVSFVVPLANKDLRLFSDHDALVIQVEDKSGFLGKGAPVEVVFDGGTSAAQSAQPPSRGFQTPPLTIQDNIPPSILAKFRKHPGQMMIPAEVLKGVMSEGNLQQRLALLDYFTGPLGFRYVYWLLLPLFIAVTGFMILPKIFYALFGQIKTKNFFKKDPDQSLEELRGELLTITGRLRAKIKEKEQRGTLNPNWDRDMKIIDEIIGPVNGWIQILLENPVLGPHERDTIIVKAGELAHHISLNFTGDDFQNLSELWKNDTRYLVKLRGLLARLCIVTGNLVARDFHARPFPEDEIETREVAGFLGKMADFGENFNEGYQLGYRLIALTQVLDLYPPKLLRGHSGLSFSERREIWKNRRMIWTFPVLRFLLQVSLMVWINKKVALATFRKVATHMNKLNISGFKSVEDAVKIARRGLHASFRPTALVDELEGNKMDGYYGRWLGRFLTVIGVLFAVKAPLVFTVFGLHSTLAQGSAALIQLIIPVAAVWRHVGPMLRKLNGEGYAVWKQEIQRLRNTAKLMAKKMKLPNHVLPGTGKAAQISGSQLPEAGDKELMLLKMQQALTDAELVESTEMIVLLPPALGEHQKFFEAMVREDPILRAFHFKVKESDGDFPGTAGRFFAARGLAQFLGQKIQIYWFPRPEVPFPVAMAVFKANLAEALRMVRDFRQNGMQFGEFIFPGGDLSGSVINYAKKGSHVVLDARPSSLNEIENERYPVILGRNGSPRHEVTHIVSRPEDLRGILSNYNRDLKVGFNMANRIAPQFPVPKGTVALTAGSREEYARISGIISVFQEKVRDLIGRYGAFPVELVEDFAAPLAEFRRQLNKRPGVSPNLQRLPHSQRRFADGSIANPYGKIYSALAQTLWQAPQERNAGSLDVEAFVPSAAGHFFVSGAQGDQILPQLRTIAKDFPGLVTFSALQNLEQQQSLKIPKPDLIFLDDHGQTVVASKETGVQRKLWGRKVAGVVTTGSGEFLLQRRSYLARSNAGLYDFLFEHLEPGETLEQAMTRGFVEEFRAGRPLPDSLDPLPLSRVSEVQYEVEHERRRTAPTTLRESAVVFHIPLNGSIRGGELLPGEDASEIVRISPEMLRKLYQDQHGIFTPRTYAVLQHILPQMDAIFSSRVAAGRSEIRKGKVFSGQGEGRFSPLILNVSSAKTTPLVQSVNREKEPDTGAAPKTVRETPEDLWVDHGLSKEIRILTAIVLAQKVLAVSDSELFPQLKSSLEDSGKILSRVIPALAAWTHSDSASLQTLEEHLRSLLSEKQFHAISDRQIIFLDASILSEDYLTGLHAGSIPVFVVFDRFHQEHYEKAVREWSRGKLAGNIFPVYASEGVSAFVRKALHPGQDSQILPFPIRSVLEHFRDGGKEDDMVLIARGRAESQKVESHYVGHRYYYAESTLRLDPELIYYSLELLLRSPELFRYGSGRNAQDTVSLIGMILQQLAIEMRAGAVLGHAA